MDEIRDDEVLDDEIEEEDEDEDALEIPDENGDLPIDPNEESLGRFGLNEKDEEEM